MNNLIRTIKLRLIKISHIQIEKKKRYYDDVSKLENQNAAKHPPIHKISIPHMCLKGIGVHEHCNYNVPIFRSEKFDESERLEKSGQSMKLEKL